ncbi:MAG: IPT/TIG domain-containing protein [Patescibacteria group bacterium]
MRKEIKKFILIFILVIGLAGAFLWHANLASAQVDLGVEAAGDTIGLASTDIRVIVAKIIKTALGLLGIVAIVLVLYGGYVWMTAGGDEEKISQAKKILVNSFIGLAIILSSYAITSFVLNRLISATTGVENSGGNMGGGGGGGNPYFPSSIFYVDSLPKGGVLCVRNVHLAVTFNKEINPDTLADNLVLEKEDGSPAGGSWSANGNTAVFIPSGDCGSGPSDCLDGLTKYILKFKNSSAIKSSDGLVLNCSIKDGCGNVAFTTGDGVDRLPPQVQIQEIPGDLLKLGSMIPVTVNFTDDNGVQKIDFGSDGYFAESKTISGCQKSGSVSFNWVTAGLSAGEHALKATGFDWSMMQFTANSNVSLLPNHCFDTQLQSDLGETVAGPPACGGECGGCSGSSCTNNSQCSSGYCELSGGSGTCVDKMRINGVSPLSGAPGTFISISGSFFGSSPGKVFINDKQANLASCGIGGWKPWQIIVEVPDSAESGPIRVETNEGAGAKLVDSTNDDWGPRLSDFTVNSTVRPGLCAIVPDSSLPGQEIELTGKNFGNALGKVYFGQTAGLVGLSSWADVYIKARVPILNSGNVGVKVARNGVDSNSLRFFIESDDNTNGPIISSVNPESGAKGEYITIIGKNFGDQRGKVWFKLVGADGQPSGDAIDGSFNFPAECDSTWTDKQIIVKFPENKGGAGNTYFVQVRSADISKGWSALGSVFKLNVGMPKPGICEINPVSGPVPFASSSAVLRIAGEYFGSSPSAYFWTHSASATSTEGRLVAESSNLTTQGSLNIITTQPPLGTQSGPIIVYRNDDLQLSNPRNFAVKDCVSNNLSCPEENTHCCATGPEVGSCKPNGALCDGETLSSGYVWRFSTKDIPEVPRVIERCDRGTEGGRNLPSPSPSIQWDSLPSDDHHNVCRSASVAVEFNVNSINPISRSSLIINECDAGSVNTDQRSCVSGGNVEIDGAGDIAPQPSTEARSYIKLNPSGSYNGGKWKDNTWYQVVLKDNISAGTGDTAANLLKNKTCNVSGSAYCFLFRAGERDCRIRSLIITPYSYRTRVLEAPIKQRSNFAGDPENLFYSAHGLSDQKCIIMNVNGFGWQWSSANILYADIFSGANAEDMVQVSALQNTVGVGLVNPQNAVNISVTASTGSLHYNAGSPLTIDLSDPEVIDSWPKCSESCPNAEIGARFNTTMSELNLENAVNMYECADENCFEVTPVAVNGYLDQDSNYTVLKIANLVQLKQNTIYKISLSASSSAASPTQLWSASVFGDPTTYSKPYNKEYSWKFKTKNEKCAINRVEVSPKVYTAGKINDRAVYEAQAYSSPDSCDASGQKIDPWKADWSWSSSDALVAEVRSFSTKGLNPYCTQYCVRRGSDIPAGASVIPVCGNGIVEAGEDCDQPDKSNGCGLKCTKLGNTSTSTCGNGIVESGLGEECDPQNTAGIIGCGNDCLRQGSSAEISDVADSLCGNGYIGSGEDCDVGIAGSASNSQSAMGCSEKCLRLGTRLSKNWCSENSSGYGGFTKEEFEISCKTAMSQCGDKVASPDEDPGCDNSASGWNSELCNSRCLLKNGDAPVDISGNGCAEAVEDGCVKGKHKGSSLMYSQPSVCGDQVVGKGEDAFCETNLSSDHVGLKNPWSLAVGIGMGETVGTTTPTQIAEIKAETDSGATGIKVGASGEFRVPCGFSTDQECRSAFGGDWSLGKNSCCYRKPALLSVYPGATSSIKHSICPNSVVEVEFDREIDLSTANGNFVLARGMVGAGVDGISCGGNEDVTSLLAINNQKTSPWYKKIVLKITKFFKGLFSQEASALRTEIRSAKWCAGSDLGSYKVQKFAGKSKLSVSLTKPLEADTDYAVILKDGIRDRRGASIGKNSDGKNISWKFITAPKMCEVEKVEVEPSQILFGSSGASSTLNASALTLNGSRIQPIPGHYSWDYAWQPFANSYVTIENTTSSINTIFANNRNGEIDIRATAMVSESEVSGRLGPVATGKSHVIVFLCERPWPPKDLSVAGGAPVVIFPYEDKFGNNDGYNLTENKFDNTSIPAAALGGYFNFSSYYCADNGVYGSGDDLPYLRAAVQTSPQSITSTNIASLKRFIFTNERNNDAIGIQIFSNPNHLAIKDWFERGKAEGGIGFYGDMKDLRLDGYEAITDGNNIYVDALNVNSSLVRISFAPVCFFPAAPSSCFTEGERNIYSNIYLFSINASARPETRKVFEQMMENLEFNTNLTNYRYCGADVENPGSSVACQTDLDCPSGEVCSAQVDKLKRNYTRLRDLEVINDALE